MKKKSKGIGILGIVVIVIIILKLFGLIHLSWIWILSPIWIPFTLIFIVAIIWIVGLGVSLIISSIKDLK